MGLLQREEDLVSQNMAEVLNYSFASRLTIRFSSHITEIAEGEGSVWKNEDPKPTVDQIPEHLMNLQVHKSMGSDEMTAG